MPDSPEKPSSRIAVIAVHGVADQQPCDTARAAADMLLRVKEITKRLQPRTLSPDSIQPTRAPEIKPGIYQGFVQQELRIAVSPLRLRPVSPSPPEEREFSFYEWLRSALSFEIAPYTIKPRRHSPSEREKMPEVGGREVEAKKLSSADAMSLEYMDEQLRDCVLPASEKTYETIRLDSIRTGSRAHVHVFEMYWADLSRPVGNLIRWLLEFYQLLFQLCMLGRKSLAFAGAEYHDAARKERPRWAWLWWVFGWSQLIAEQALALAVPILGLYLLALCLAISPAFLKEESLVPVIVGSATGIVAVTIGLVVYWIRRRIPWRGRAWPLLLLLPLGAAGVVLFCFLCHVTPETAPIHAVWLAWVVAALGVLVLMLSHQKTRKGAFPMGLMIGGLVTIFLGTSLWGMATALEIFSAVVRTADLTAWALLGAWIVVMFFATVATLAGFVIGLAVPGEGEPHVQARDRVRRAAWTTNLTLVLPALTVVILNLSLWQALVVAFVPDSGTVGKEWNAIKSHEVWRTPVETFVHRYKPSLPLEEPLGTGKATGAAWDVTRAMVKRASTPLYFVVAGFFGLAAVLLIWSIVPAVIVEIRPGKGKDLPKTREAKSAWLGQSLSAGFRAMRVSGEFVRGAFLLFLPVVLYAKWKHPELLDTSHGLNRQFLYLGAVIVLGIVASRGPFKWLALGLRSGLDVALDVINWLRLHPREANPRGRICARYASLLREIGKWRDPADETQGFDAIVILAHSQGTVITADLLRYLNREDREKGDEGIRPLPIYLFTMGCPLRQLYSLRFPHLYGWARHAGKTWAGTEPLPSEINVKLWVNAYRSGDYVGRHLWHPDPGEEKWSTREVYVHGQKREFCIGAGAHTHYWDETAPEIAVELDRLIGLAAHEA